MQLVRKIEYSKEGVKVTTEDGTGYTSNYAIVSVSLGVLQSTLIDFVPDLPVRAPLLTSPCCMTDFFYFYDPLFHLIEISI